MPKRPNQQRRRWILKLIQVAAFALLYAWALWNRKGLESTIVFVVLPADTDPVDASPPMPLNTTLVDSKLNASKLAVKREGISSFEGGSSILVPDGDTSMRPQSDESLVQSHSNENTSIRTSMSSIPAALRPVTFRGCCSPKDTSNMNVKVCLTKEACTKGSLYPFSTRNESILLEKYVPTGKKKKKLIRKCRKANAQLQPGMTWCSNITASKFPTGCSHLTMAGNSGPYDRALLFPSNKLLFCGIPKAGITQWLQFLRFTRGAKDYQSNPYSKFDARLFYFDKIHPKHQGHIWKNYTKAILLREPAERLLSAYLDKVALKRNDTHEPTSHGDHTGSTRTKRSKEVFGYNISFAGFVNYLSMTNVTRVDDTYRGWTGLSWRSDPHWRPQAWSCGLSENIQEFDYIGTLDNASLHTKHILERVGLWESYGRHYRTSKEVRGTRAKTWPPPPLQRGETAVGFQQTGTNTNDQHNRNSRAKLDAYYTPGIMKKVKEIYWMDFALWDAVKLAETKGDGHVSGKDIGKLLNPECDQ